jgi:hypothetical protein
MENSRKIEVNNYVYDYVYVYDVCNEVITLNSLF